MSAMSRTDPVTPARAAPVGVPSLDVDPFSPLAKAKLWVRMTVFSSQTAYATATQISVRTVEVPRCSM